MQLFLTGALAFNNPQTQPNLSIGGLVSSTLVSNGSVNNIFNNAVAGSNAQTITVIALKNDATLKPTISLFITPDTDFTYKIGVQKCQSDPYGNYYCEKLPNAHAMPFNCQMFTANQADPLTILNVEANEWIAIYIQRSTIHLPQQTNAILYQQYLDKTTVTSKQVTFSLSIIDL